MDYFQKNLALLGEHDPYLARRVRDIDLPRDITVFPARDGHPVLQAGKVSLHSTYHPNQEAARRVSEYVSRNGPPNTVYGLGFGYHILEILASQQGDLRVIEPSIEIFRVFLSVMDLKPFLPRTRFLVEEPPEKVLARHQPQDWNTFEHPPSIQIASLYFERLERGLGLMDTLKSHPLRILVINPIYGGSLPTAHYCAGALKDLGHHVSTVDCEKFADGYFSLDGVSRKKQNAEILSHLFMNLMGEIAAARAADFQPDLILALAQAPLTPRAIERLKTLGVPVAFWFVEDFRTLTYWEEIAGCYDYFFTLQRGEFFGRLSGAGVKKFYYLPQACYPKMHRPLVLSAEKRQTFGADLSFMGAAYYNRIQSFPRLLEYDFKIWGTGWDLKSPVGQRAQNGNQRVTPEEAIKIYNGGGINLNLHSSTYHEGVHPEGDFINPRTFEIAACAGFQLVDHRSELEELFKVGEEMVTFHDIEELKDKINYYLVHEEERTGIAGKASRRVLAEHTLQHRLNEMLLHIFLDHPEHLNRRLAPRKDPVDYFIRQAGEDTELGRYLEPFRGVPEFSLKTLIDPIEKGAGALNKSETLLLMLNQLIKEEA
ncbi:MAG: glycosyltransferase [Nitrospinaceae bacterium]